MSAPLVAALVIAVVALVAALATPLLVIAARARAGARWERSLRASAAHEPPRLVASRSGRIASSSGRDLGAAA